ncbi:MAG: hypothetical protein CL840_14000 [Crocinitomicaceae bacterium]|nr:hypothetical protein [Crocinitomicaceae bacterium]|tara:strand:- start:7341 stop:9335 length:1995 start_codon:yes stop_codon:yes gene_type:complete
MKRSLLLFVLILPFFLIAQKKAELEVIKMRAETNKANKTIKLVWESRTNGSYTLYKRNSLSDTWGTPFKTFSFTETEYTDSNITVGEDQEYHLVHSTSGKFAHGYLYSGIEKEAQHNMNGILLLIDSTYAVALESEINRLEDDLFNEGWYVGRLYVNRSLVAFQVKNKLINKMSELGNNFDAIFIIGHVAVPYSGDFKAAGIPPPDGHIEGRGNHTGAWSADVYYADRNGTWTDNSVNNTSGNQSRNHNKPNDGKYDQTITPSEPEYQLGRVDMYNLPAFSKSDTLLLKEYLDRNHRWRTGQISVVERGLIDNNFAGLNLASTGWHNLTTLVHSDSVTIRDYKTSQKSDSYLWSFGCGAGSYTSCSGVIKTTDFAKDSLQNIYTILSGSYFGDYDSKNNLLRSALANSSLVTFWGGIPKWYVHTMGLGKNIGYGARVSQGNSSEYFNGNFNFSHNKIHIALLGDPSLTLSYIKPPMFPIGKAEGNDVVLNWKGSLSPVKGYFIYRFDTVANKFIQLNNEPLKGFTYTDKTNKYSGNFKYLIRAVEIDTTPSGTYQNLSAGVNTTVRLTYSDPTSISESILDNTFELYPNPGNGEFTLRFVNFRESDLVLRVFDGSGKIVYADNIFSDSGVNTLEVSTELPTGIYWISLSDGLERVTRKLVVTSH